MLFDLQDQAVTEKIFKKFDTIIIGAGAAGITTAITLEKFGKSVALVEGGEIELSPAHPARKRLDKAVELALQDFYKNGGGSSPHGGAMYTQLCVAYLCAEYSDTGVYPIIPRLRRVGEVVVEKWGANPGDIKNHLRPQYVQGVSEVCWGQPEMC